MNVEIASRGRSLRGLGIWTVRSTAEEQDLRGFTDHECDSAWQALQVSVARQEWSVNGFTRFQSFVL